VLVVSLVIFLIVTLAVALGAHRYRGKEGDAEPRQIFGHKKLELIWTIIPACIVVTILALSGRVMGKVEAPSNIKPDLIVTAHQWWWEAFYTATGARAANEIHIPVGKKWLVDLESADVIHDFWTPNLAPKMDVIPGHPNRIWLEADRPGTYAGACAEFCGAQHAWMRFFVIAEPAAEFEAWEQRQLQPMTAEAAALPGRKVFQEMMCVNCHEVGGVAAGTNATAGPDLTHVAGRATLAGGVLTNSEANLELWLQDPQAIKPACLMPNFHLTEEQRHDLAAFFEATP
jgi:cytochrome c oxidase subunit 2